MNDDDDPPSRATPSSSRSSLPPPAAGGLEWPDDETFASASVQEAATAKRPAMSARILLDESALDLNISLIAGASGVERPINHSRIQKSGLALAGHFHGIVPSRIQILGQTEQSFVTRLEPAARQRALVGFFGLGLSCVVVTGELNAASREVIACADLTGTPLLHSAERSSVTITNLHALLDERLAPRKRLHGVLIDVFGVGLLLIGPSEVGKSECALDLVMRGHRLVADDVVECDYRPPGMVFGAPAKLLRHHLEVRGLGILNIKDLFGVTAIRERKRIDVVVRLVEESSAEAEHDRLGLDDRYHAILSVQIPELVIPVRPGRDMATILEVAARNELLKNAGHHAARELFGAIESRIASHAATGSHGDLEVHGPRTAAGAARDGGPAPSSAVPGVFPAAPAGPQPGGLPAIARGRPLSPAIRSQESQYGMPAVRMSRTDESAAPPPVTTPSPKGRTR